MKRVMIFAFLFGFPIALQSQDGLKTYMQVREKISEEFFLRPEDDGVVAVSYKKRNMDYRKIIKERVVPFMRKTRDALIKKDMNFFVPRFEHYITDEILKRYRKKTGKKLSLKECEELFLKDLKNKKDLLHYYKLFSNEKLLKALKNGTYAVDIQPNGYHEEEKLDVYAVFFYPKSPSKPVLEEYYGLILFVKDDKITFGGAHSNKDKVTGTQINLRWHKD